MARKLCRAHDRTVDEAKQGALVAYNAGAGGAVRYWDALARTAIVTRPEAVTDEPETLQQALADTHNERAELIEALNRIKLLAANYRQFQTDHELWQEMERVADAALSKLSPLIVGPK